MVKLKTWKVYGNGACAVVRASCPESAISYIKSVDDSFIWYDLTADDVVEMVIEGRLGVLAVFYE